MQVRRGRGDFVQGAFVKVVHAKGAVESLDPARNFAPVFTAATDVAHVDIAVEAATRAQPGWHAIGLEGRLAALHKLRAAFDARVDEIATAIVHETGKPIREGQSEAKSLGARITLMENEGLKRIETMRPAGIVGEARAHPQGVLAVIGPYNFPAHLVNAHVIPALMTGNTVVIKASEYCPWTAELYAQCALDAGLPPGVLNLVQGARDAGVALVEHPGVHGVLFTGSYPTGRAIAKACLEQPHKITALEMGGKNVAIICDDADLGQALAGVLQGAFLSAGQRCTATSRVLVDRRVANRFIDALVDATERLVPGDPWEPNTTFGPLSNRPAYDRFLGLRKRAVEVGCEPLVDGQALGGGAFVTPSVHLLPEGMNEAPGYLDEELFGPDICLEVVDDLDHAIARTNALPYGLANAVFTADDEKFEKVFRETRSGVLNKNHSTNGASGMLPFGGVGKSGNQRPAGIDAMRYTTFPVTILEGKFGDHHIEHTFQSAFEVGYEHFTIDIERLSGRQAIEELFERHRIGVDRVTGPEVHVNLEELTDLIFDDDLLTDDEMMRELGPGVSVGREHLVLVVPENRAEAAALVERVRAFLWHIADENPRHLLAHPEKKTNAPTGGALPRSAGLLRRLYRGDFVPREKKTPVIDLGRSEGAYLRSIDEDPLVILDAASQIASIGLGFNPGEMLRALDEGTLSDALIANPDTTVAARDDVDEYAAFLTSHAWAGIQHASFTAGGSEANEKAFDLCRMNGPGGKRIIAFEGSFHGRTLMSLHATYNPDKRVPFEFKGYEASYVPFPAWRDPREEPNVSKGWIDAWSEGRTPEAANALMQAEIASLLAVKAEVEKGDVCAVIVEPMQGEGGDNYATARFFNGLRALTRHLKVPLIFDEVQTGFGLGGTFFWHSAFKLKDKSGAVDGPDCITLAKKAQVGVCLSAWRDPRPSPAHVVEAVRGHLHGRGIAASSSRGIEQMVRDRLWKLALDFPELVENPRNRGLAFGFDLPTAHIANQIVNQRFYRGYMVYIAGERTVRFRLNRAFGTVELTQLFDGISAALRAVVQRGVKASPGEKAVAMNAYVAPAWIDQGDDDEALGKRANRLQGFKELSTDPPALLRWMLGLPRGPLERVCDRALANEGQYEETRVESALKALIPGCDPAQLTTGAVLGALKAISTEVDAAADPAKAYAEHAARLGLGPSRLLVEAVGCRVVTITASEWERYKDGVVEIENATYEPGRRETEAQLRAMVEGDGGVGLLLRRRTDSGERVLGYAFGGPVEQYSADGPKQDAFREAGNTFYSSNITVAPGARGAGLGMRLKHAQLEEVRALKRDDGTYRYAFITGRNRVGRTAEMTAINRAFGAYVVEHYKGNQYGDLSGEAVYYRIPIRRPGAPTAYRAPKPREHLDWASSVESPLGHNPERLARALMDGAFNGAVGTKLTLSNWVTPDIVRYGEILRELAPRGLAHAYFTSGRDELVDKGLRCLRVSRPKAQMVIGLERQFLGNITAAARSLSDSSGQAEPFGWFDWPKVPHPAEVGDDAALGAIMALINQHTPANILGVVVELVGEKSGLVVSDAFMSALDAIRKDTGIPIVAVETASALGRTSGHVFRSDALAVRPSMVWWYTGAQLGHIFADESTYVKKPLTLISTWDGDEIAIIRTREHLLEAHARLTSGTPARFEAALADAKIATPRSGAGLWQAFHVGDDKKASAVLERAKSKGLVLKRGLPGKVIACPPITLDDAELQRGIAMLKDALS